jgi:hypothetical protein
MRTFIITIACLGLHCLYAQHPVAVQRDLLKDFKKIEYWSMKHDAASAISPYDSLEKANTTFRNKLLKYTRTVHASMDYEFNELAKLGLVITTSDDGLFRIYSWNTWMGGTSYQFAAVIQYKLDNKLFSTVATEEVGGMGVWYSIIHTFKADDKTYYLAVYNAKESARYCYQGIKAFCIEKNRLNDSVKLIKTPTGIHNGLGFEYDLISAPRQSENPPKLIYFDDDEEGELCLSVVKEDGRVTNRFITYQFTGKYFERVASR